MERLARLLRGFFASLTRAPGGVAKRHQSAGRGRYCEVYRASVCNVTSMNVVTGHSRGAERIEEFLARTQAKRFQGRTCCDGCRAVSEALPERVLEPVE